MKILLIILAIIAIIVIWLIGTYNKFIKLSTEVDEAFSSMDVSLKKRTDLIPNLIECVKGYVKHEKSTLNEIVEARNSVLNASTQDQRMEAENALGSTLGRLFALAESYPDLKANTNFLNLQDQLGQTETEIANARRYYNAVVKKFNVAIKVFPAVLIANMLHYGPKAMYELEDESERQNVKVEF